MSFQFTVRPQKLCCCSVSHIWYFATAWTAARQASLSFSISQNLLKLMSIELMIPFNHLILFHPLLLQPSIFPNISIFSNELALRIRWSKNWSFSFSISPSNEYSGLISFRIDWLDLLAAQGTLKSLLQHHSSKHQFFTSHPSLWSSCHICTYNWKNHSISAELIQILKDDAIKVLQGIIRNLKKTLFYWFSGLAGLNWLVLVWRSLLWLWADGAWCWS